MLASTKVGRRYKTTIPREVRKILGLGEGDEVEWAFEDVVRRRGHG